MKTVSFFKGFSTVVKHSSLEEVFSQIKQCIYGYLIRSLRRLLKEGNEEGYDQGKRQLPAFTPSGKFVGGRKMEFLQEYSQVIVLDIDKLTEEEVIRVKKIIVQCKYTHACFVSPSGKGLKVFICVSTGVKEHLNTFVSLQKFYKKITGVEIDASGKDVSRLCFVSMDEDLYYNPGSLIYNPLLDESQLWPSTKPTGPGLKGGLILPAVNGNEGPPDEVSPKKTSPRKTSVTNNNSTDPNLQTQEIPEWITQKNNFKSDNASIIKIYARAVAYVKRHSTFIRGQRNTFVFGLALQLSRAGLPEETTLMLLLQDYNFGEREVRNCVKSAYSYNQTNPAAHTNGREKETGLAPDSNTNTPSGKIKRKRTPLVNPPKDKGDINEPPDDDNSTSEEPPYEPPKTRKNNSKDHYDIRSVENLVKQYFETRYNEVTGLVEFRKAHSKKPFERLTDYDENSLFRKLHFEEQLVPISTLHLILNSDFSREYNPFREYFSKLTKWDGKTDFIGQLIATVKTEDDKYWGYCFRKWFVGYAASMVDDQVINQTVCVFVGAQGVGKTTWMKKLAPESLQDYVGTAILQSDSKDTAIQLTECCLIILDELENLNRKDLGAFKELITRPGIRIRRPYGRINENLPHRASIFAAVNYEKMLTDPTGTRRYLCSKVLSIDYLHTVSIDGALAQAYALYKSGFKFWFDQEEIKDINYRNEDFMAKTIEEELIETWLRPVTQEEWDSKDKFANGQNIQLMNATQIAIFFTGKAKINLMDSTNVKIGKIMKKQGFKQVRKGNNTFYMLRLVENEAVDRNIHTLEDLESQKKEKEDNEQIIRLEEDLSGGNIDDDLPF